MGHVKRRHFLQGAVGALAALGWSQLEVQRQGLRYGKVLAQGTSRKLALLVGINNYFQPEIRDLQGCMTDVELQRELLVHRFGFNPKDVLLITDKTEIKPTRSGIIQAVEEHLIKQAKPGDVVVFHFSGHGSRVVNPYRNAHDSRERLNSTFVPSDRAASEAEGRATVSDIMGATLFLWMSAIATENLTVVLDCCHSGGGKRGNLTIRALGGGEYPSLEEREYHQQWLSQLKISQEKFIEERQKGVAKGVVIASAAANQLAADLPFDGFHAGAFTYLLTQYLWQQTGDRGFETVLANVSRSTTRISSTRQTPEMEVKPGSGNETKPSYFLKTQLPPAEAVIRSVRGDRVEFWLGGIDPQSFSAFEKDALFAVVDAQGNEAGLIKLDKRQGLIGQGIAQDVQQTQVLQPGAVLQERARGIPSNLTLRIGLDESLGDEIEQAKAAIATLDRVEPVPLGETQVQYIFGRMTEQLQQEFKGTGAAEIPPVGSLGLYGPGLDVIPGSFGAVGETVSQASDRLKSKFRSLLAARIVKLTLNAESSQLNVAASLKVLQETETQIAATVFTPRTTRNLSLSEGTTGDRVSSAIATVGGIPQLPIGVNVQCQIENRDTQDLYIVLLVVTTTGDLVVLFPNSWTDGVDAALVKAGETRKIPDPDSPFDRFKLTVNPPVGMSEILIIASISPLRDSLKRLQSIASERNIEGQQPMGLGDRSISAIDNLLGDFDRSSRNTGERNITRNLVASFDPNSRAARTQQIAALSITYAVVDG